MERDMVLGSDAITKGKALHIIFVFFLFAFLSWAAANSPQDEKAIFYSILSIGSLLFILIDLALFKRAKIEFLDSVTYEPNETRPSFFQKIPNSVMIFLGFMLILFIAFSIANTQFSFVSAPTYSIMTFTQEPLFRAFMSGMAGIAENLFFFAVMFPTLVAVLNKIFNLPFPAALVFGILGIGVIFVFYHALVYGSANLVASISVFIFGAVNGILVYAFRNLFLSDIFHFFNNFLVVMLGVTTIGFVVVPV
jgi:hypothetical protein